MVTQYLKTNLFNPPLSSTAVSSKPDTINKYLKTYLLNAPLFLLGHSVLPAEPGAEQVMQGKL